MNIGNDIKSDDEFFKEVKRTVGITWEDEATDNNVRDYIRQGVEVLQNDVGTSIDFEKDDSKRNSKNLLQICKKQFRRIFY